MKKMYIALGIIGMLVLAWLVATAWQIDDWSRDLTHNQAATDASALDAALHPLVSSLAPEELAALVEKAAAELPRWELASRTTANGTITLAYVRSTALWRFKDDIVVRVAPADAGSVATAESRSRVGKGDLGQNPRNLKELLSAVRGHLEKTDASR